MIPVETALKSEEIIKAIEQSYLPSKSDNNKPL